MSSVINLGHRKRLKSCLQKDASQLADYEILELLLAHVMLRCDTRPLAKNLLGCFGSLRGVLDAQPNELLAVHGFGNSLLLFWQLLREFMARYAEAPVRRKEVLCTPEAVAYMARIRLAGCPHEELWLALLDKGNRLVAWEKLRSGSVAKISVAPRDVFELALQHKASNMIMVHNHPGGNIKPSSPDLHLTEELARLGPALGITLLDHVLVTEDKCFSISRDRLLQI